MRSDLHNQIYHLEESYWWYKSRRNLIKELLPKRKSLKILDIGCGTGKLMEELQPYGQIYGLDASPKAVDFCHRRHLHRVYQATFPKIHRSINQHRFDVIICLDVLEHIRDDRLALQTINRLLRPRGRLIITVPAYPWLFSYWDKLSGHHRRYSASQLLSLLDQAHLKIIKLSYLYSFLLPLAIPFRLIRNHFFKQSPKSDFIKLASGVNQLLFGLATLERVVLKYVNLPFGLSLLCVAQKCNSH